MSPSDETTTASAELIGCFLSIFFFGLLCSQTYTYYQTFKHESRVLDFQIGLLWLFDLGQTVCLADVIFHNYVQVHGSGSDTTTSPPIKSFPLALAFSSLVEFVVRFIYVERIRKFGRATQFKFVSWVVAACHALTIIVFIANLGGSITLFRAASLSAFFARWRWLVISSCVLMTVVDVMIAAALCHVLSVSKSGGRSSRTVDTLIRWTIETSLLTSLTAVIDLVCFVSLPDSFIYVGIYSALPKLYSNSLLALLNGRAMLRERSQNEPVNISKIVEMDTPSTIEPTVFQEPKVGSLAASVASKGTNVGSLPSIQSQVVGR